MQPEFGKTTNTYSHKQTKKKAQSGWFLHSLKVKTKVL